MRISSDGKVRRTAAEWSEIFARFDRSGLSRDQFCEKENIRVVTFARWHTRLHAPKPRTAAPKSKSKSPATSTPFVEMSPPRPTPVPWSVELELPGGYILRLRA